MSMVLNFFSLTLWN